MSNLTPEKSAALAAALVRLRAETLAKIEAATGIRAPNLSVWLRGKQQVLSEQRAVTVLDHLGVHGTRLRTDVLHSWRIRGGLDDLKTVLGLLLDDMQRKGTTLYRDNSNALRVVRLLRIPQGDQQVLVWVTVEPGLAAAADLMAEDLGFGSTVISSEPLSELPQDMAELEKALDRLHEPCDVSDIPSFSSLSDEVSELFVPGFTSNEPATWEVSEMDRLHAELMRVLGAGVTPEQIVTMLAKNFP
ncbi:hypothetical protein D3C81_1317450 [compost metagenome]